MRAASADPETDRQGVGIAEIFFNKCFEEYLLIGRKRRSGREGRKQTLQSFIRFPGAADMGDLILFFGVFDQYGSDVLTVHMPVSEIRTVAACVDQPVGFTVQNDMHTGKIRIPLKADFRFDLNEHRVPVNTDIQRTDPA